MKPTSEMRVLVVEDQDDARTLIRYHLGDSFNLTFVTGYDEAVRQATEHTFDLFILDINLGEKRTGINLLQFLRSQPRHQSVRALALTAYALPGDRERFLEAGFSAYLSKPFSRETLRATVAKLLDL